MTDVGCNLYAVLLKVDNSLEHQNVLIDLYPNRMRQTIEKEMQKTIMQSTFELNLLWYMTEKYHNNFCNNNLFLILDMKYGLFEFQINTNLEVDKVENEQKIREALWKYTI